jgi:6,7-dimethyl-8-ribityllumazine synthase
MSAQRKSSSRASATASKAISSPLRFAIVVSDYNHEYTQGLLEAARDCLQKHDLTVFHVPGAFEIPLQVQRLAKSGTVDGILALGVIWQGKTRHAEEIGRAVTDALMRIMLENNLPVFHEVLTIRNQADARERCLKKKLNRGREAGQAALALLLPGHPVDPPRNHA